MARRVAAIAAVMTLGGGNLAVCAGWQATPEARMACCTNGTSCPMHKSESKGSVGKRVITQAQADNCCAAASTSAQSSVPNPTYLLSNVAALPAASRLPVAVRVLALQQWRTVIPLPASPVPKYLLLSVLLV